MEKETYSLKFISKMLKSIHKQKTKFYSGT